MCWLSMIYSMVANSIISFFDLYHSRLSISLSGCFSGDDISRLNVEEHHERAEEEEWNYQHKYRNCGWACAWLDWRDDRHEDRVAYFRTCFFVDAVLHILILHLASSFYKITEKKVCSQSQISWLNTNISIKDFVVPCANTVVDPRTMMIKDIDTPLTLVTMPASRSSQDFTFIAQSVGIIFHHQIEELQIQLLFVFLSKFRFIDFLS